MATTPTPPSVTQQMINTGIVGIEAGQRKGFRATGTRLTQAHHGRRCRPLRRCRKQAIGSPLLRGSVCPQPRGLRQKGQVGPPWVGWTAPLRDRMRAAVSLLRAGWTAQGRLDRPIHILAKRRVKTSSWQVGPPGQVGPPVARMCDSSSWAGWTAQGRLDRPPHSGTSSCDRHHGRLDRQGRLDRPSHTSGIIIDRPIALRQVGPPGQVGPPATLVWRIVR